MVNSDRSRIEAKKKALSRERLYNWCIWKVLLPVGMIGILYPIYRLVLEIEHPFPRAFVHGDLILLSVLILLEAAVEGEHINDRGTWLQAMLKVARLGAILLMLVYGFLKADVVRREHDLYSTTAQAAGVITKFTYYSYFNWAIVVLSVVYSFAAFWAVMAREQDELLGQLAGEPKQ